MKTTYLLVILFLVVVFTGCATTEYLDSPAPSGTVAPVPTQARTSSPEGGVASVRTGAAETAAGVSSADTFRKIVASEAETPATIAAPSEDAGEVIARFGKVYAGQNSPRMTLFLNRSLGDEIAEWSGSERFVATGDGKFKLADKTAVNAGAAIDNNIHTSGGFVTQQSRFLQTGTDDTVLDIQVNNDSLVLTSQQKKGLGGARSQVVETNMWRIENSFLNLFLEARANMVDRTTIMRLMASETDTNSLVDIPEKTIEMSALKKYSDIYIELLVNGAGQQYEFKAVAKETDTGKILGIATSSEIDPADYPGSRKYVATATGYRKVQEKITVEWIVDKLSLNLMKSLIRCWEK